LCMDTENALTSLVWTKLLKKYTISLAVESYLQEFHCKLPATSVVQMALIGWVRRAHY
jgi:hypothetical protein